MKSKKVTDYEVASHLGRWFMNLYGTIPPKDTFDEMCYRFHTGECFVTIRDMFEVPMVSEFGAQFPAVPKILGFYQMSITHYLPNTGPKTK